MKILSIDTSSPICAVAILDNKEVLKEISLNNGLTHSESLMPLIKQILNDTNLTLQDIDLLSCDKGPGSFTGIRIGIATTKAFSDSLGIKAIGISSLEALAYNVSSNGFICSIIDARKENVYSQIFENIDGIYIERGLASFENIDDLITKIKHLNLDNNITFVGDGCINYKSKILSKLPNSQISLNNELSAVNVALSGLFHLHCSDFTDLNPLYLRKSQAEQILEDTKNANNISIFPMTIHDLNKISNILETDFDDFWNYNVFKSELENPNSKYFIAKKGDEIIGFAGLICVIDEAEITNVVIKKIYRGKHISSILIETIIEYCKENNITKINLEVSLENEIAINLYKKFGFNQVGLRKNYYKNSDAILMNLCIK